jgi:Exonuclease III
MNPEVLLLSETWLSTSTMKLIHNSYEQFNSPPQKYEGVAILSKKELKARPVRQNDWTPNYMFVAIGNLIVISCYLNPRRKNELLETVIWFANDFIQ